MLIDKEVLLVHYFPSVENAEKYFSTGFVSG